MAAPPGGPSSPRPRRSVLLALFVALFLGVALAFLAERLDRRLRDADKVRDIFGRPVLTAIPASDELAETARPGSPVAEPFRMLRANLRYFNVTQEVKSVLVTSAQPGDGKSTVAWNLAWAGGAAGTRTLLIEADLRRPSLARWAQEATPRGLSGLLSQQAPLGDVVEDVVLGRTERIPIAHDRRALRRTPASESRRAHRLSTDARFDRARGGHLRPRRHRHTADVRCVGRDSPGQGCKRRARGRPARTNARRTRRPILPSNFRISMHAFLASWSTACPHVAMATAMATATATTTTTDPTRNHEVLVTARAILTRSRWLGTHRETRCVVNR